MSDLEQMTGLAVSDAICAARIFALDPVAAKGIWVRGRSGGALDAWLHLTESFLDEKITKKRIPASISESRLTGGLDLAATLAFRRPVAERGILAEAHNGVIILPNAECTKQSVTSALSAALDSGYVALERDGLCARHEARFGVIALDEGAEAAASGLRDRLAMMIDMTHLPARAFAINDDLRSQSRDARERLASVQLTDDMIEAMCATSVALGVASLRGPLFTAYVARAAAALEGRTRVSEGDAALAVRLVLAPRATRLPSSPTDDDETQPPPPEQGDARDEAHGKHNDDQELRDILIASAAANLPRDLLASLQTGSLSRRAAGTGRAGAKQKAKHHGRRSRSRRGHPRDGAPLDLLETLRAAAPWQRLRVNERIASGVRHIEVRREDFRVRTFKNHRETTTIFVVDASGSAALHRLGEAKGAIELLLADCYSRRDHVALIAFRGKTAEVLLPPTRSLTRVKRSIASLPGGGGTPLALAAECAAVLADSVSRKGQSVTVVFLTDGKANIDRNGAASRPQAEADALAAARAIATQAFATVVIDTSPPRSGTHSSRFAAEMGARYLPLPYANAQVLSDAVRAAALR